MKAVDVILLALVGAFWGCTNPFLRKGAAQLKDDTAATNKKTDAQDKDDSNDNDDKNSMFQALKASSLKFLNIQVWLPYALNQFGSILFYVALSRSDLTLAVPICNALALVFSTITSFLVLGETVDQPIRAVLGSALVMVGVGICISTRNEE